ncbi:SPOR domain-containing protein [Sphingobium sp. AP49]|uniref:SPOR domain-containing protein n=1 Tax=Sphingobium sp. AP49 TaxID=1144307 RepID=UPI00026EDB54|nr:SPOR domain-containing protein [Sphingobium sp. AP49]WHO37528.1 SPOR domain-containing protein [Sphingobium sp. AP49]
MKRTAFGKAALSSLVVATTMVGCTGAAFRSHSAAVRQENPDKSVTAAEKALVARDGVQAVQAAEAAVRAAPNNASYRQLLGRAYVLEGRFASAETAFTDAMTLGNSDARTIVSLALVQVALGKSDAARSLLAANTDNVPAGDYGLAMAMAGDATEGVRILSAAIQDPSATARTRQNLAYAYALAGRWKDARLVVGMDLAPLAANQRIVQWAATAEPSLAPQRVAALMGVSIDAADAGLPAALALAPAASDAAPTALAEAAPEAAPAPIADLPNPVQTAAVEVTPTATLTTRIIETAVPASTPAAKPAAVVAPKAASKPAPVRTAAKRDFIVEGPAGKAKPVKIAKATTVAAPAARMQQVAFIKPVTTGASNWVVQLGAYASPAIAKDKWMSMARVNDRIAAFPVLTSQATVNGKIFHRLAISGFGNRADAQTLCQSIKAQRGQCFVREGAPNAMPQRWAVAAPRGRQFASR